MGGRDKVRDFVFEEEYVTIPLVVSDNDQDQAPFTDVVQEEILDQDNFEEPLVQNQEIVPEEQTQQPLEPIPLRRSTRKMRSAVLDDYVIFLKENEDDIGVVEDDPSTSINPYKVLILKSRLMP